MWRGRRAVHKNSIYLQQHHACKAAFMISISNVARQICTCSNMIIWYMYVGTLESKILIVHCTGSQDTPFIISGAEQMYHCVFIDRIISSAAYIYIPFSGKFWWSFWFGEFGKDCQIKNLPILIIACVPMALRIQIATFKFCQYLLRSNSPNLMLANFPAIRYNIYIYIIP